MSDVRGGSDGVVEQGRDGRGVEVVDARGTLSLVVLLLVLRVRLVLVLVLSVVQDEYRVSDILVE